MVGLEMPVGVAYGLMTIQTVAVYAQPGTWAGIVFNGIGLLIACSVLHHVRGNDARAWFDA